MAKILFATTAEGVKFYPVTITDAVVHIKGNTQKKLSEILDEIDYSGKADKVSGAVAGNFAGLDANGNLTDSGAKAADFDAAGTAQSLIEALDATPSQTAGADGLALSLTQVDGVVTGISGSIAPNTYDAAGAAATAKSEVIGTAQDAKTADTINGAKAYADAAVATAMTSIAGALKYKGTVNANADLPVSAETGDTYAVATDGTYAGKACEVGDYLVYNGSGWDAINGENQVVDEGASLAIGTSIKIATVDGVDIHVTQVEDMTKIEAVAVADTTEYADVTSLFTAPAGA